MVTLIISLKLFNTIDYRSEVEMEIGIGLFFPF